MKPQQSQRGFVLVLTLWVLVIVAIAAGYFSERVTRSVELAQQSKQNTSALIDMAATRAEILYRLATTSLNEYGLGRGNALIYLDNRSYRGVGDSVLRVQDNRGLLNLNTSEDEGLQRLLGLLGIPGDQRSHLIDTLRDFIDEDDLHRLNGAEKEEYLALNLPPPSNKNLTTPWEAHSIIGWRDAPQLWQNARLVELTTTADNATRINPNTAPAEILATLPGVTAELARLIIARRQLVPITDITQLAEITGLPIQSFEEIISGWPSKSIRITQSAPGLAWSVQYNITLSPMANDAPWQTDYYGRVSTLQRNESQPPVAVPELPPRSTAPPEVAPD